ncbi:MAG: hypothetical protein JETT_3253 [Candidatus Jettenia ecosi]|uniref:Uncharacterized protein n=1 Tax=Candidatus Jettenia ecosi TaxID=2494326 RepID=A0A533Q790_9BACT|nr:MAG: hypothetical protein JETT_3253 [Candidatus Jettenia ecosi]
METLSEIHDFVMVQTQDFGDAKCCISPFVFLPNPVGML